MTSLKCVFCGELHDIAHIEPSLLRPDPILAVPAGKRKSWTWESKDACILRPRRTLLEVFTKPSAPPRFFLRVTMPFAVVGREKPCSWGIWVEVERSSYLLVDQLWDSPNQHLQPPFRGTLANDLHGYPPSPGLPGQVQLISPSAIPVFTLGPGAHPLVAQQQVSVTEEVVLQWLHPIIHPSAPAA